jgi:hypothetical protein
MLEKQNCIRNERKEKVDIRIFLSGWISVHKVHLEALPPERGSTTNS